MVFKRLCLKLYWCNIINIFMRGGPLTVRLNGINTGEMLKGFLMNIDDDVQPFEINRKQIMFTHINA